MKYAKLKISQKLERKNDVSTDWPVLLCSGAQSILGSGSLNAHNAAKQRWQFCAFTIEALAGAVPFELDFGYRIGLWATLFLCRAGREFCMLMLHPCLDTLLCFPDHFPWQNQPLRPYSLQARGVLTKQQSDKIYLNFQFFFLLLSQYKWACD